ncbi:long-chain fatty acid--CoA ligase [Ahrensia sp. R2A130]|uniref:AMP-dependent synthetase/ligase n=1 Tax=Ahrensia sp. R2A130 TaxID=744979 RepID=UPI0001E0C361|nr:AMP-binding protein [Ahrensia sp. R2A130]EFL88771.1 long-chain-fatty-acid--CoA ligase [Ahrensia sp. R2A130]
MATDKLDTFPKLLLSNANRFSDRPAMRHKDFGIWQTWTWAETLTQVRDFSLGLKALGFVAGDKVAIVGTNRPRLYWALTAIQALGGVPVPVYSDSVAEEMVYVLQHAEVRFAVVQDQEQTDKILSIKDELPELETIIYDWERGLGDYDEPFLHSFATVQELGRGADDAARQKWKDQINAGKGEDLSVMLYTSGTTGKPKGVMLSYDNLVISARNANAFDGFDENDEIIAYLPLAWVGDHIFSYAQSLTSGYCVCCPESPDTVTENRREIAPTYFFAPPRVFEGLLTDIMVRMEDASALKQKMFHHFLGVANRVGEKLLNGDSVGLLDRLRYKLGDFLVYGPLKNRLGMSRMKVGYTAGEAIGPEIFSFYRSLGLNLKQLYGQTEASVYITAQPDGQISADTVGTPSPDVEIEIADNGEVLYRSPGTFIGYYKNDEATRETKNAEGWVKTGDAGFLDAQGHLRIIDRAKDVGKLADGSMFPPKYIENKLKFFPNIKEAVAIGDGREYAAVMLNIDLQPVANWAERNNIAYGSYQELANHPKVYDMMGDHVDQVNRDLAAEERVAGAQIARFLVLHKELDADDGELTRTMKVRRSLINERYGDLIDALYDGSSEKFVETEVVFEDGRKGKIAATVQIRDAKRHAPEAMKEAAE